MGLAVGACGVVGIAPAISIKSTGPVLPSHKHEPRYACLKPVTHQAGPICYLSNRSVQWGMLLAIFLVAAITAARPASNGEIADWPFYGGDAGGARYSPLTQINKSNVTELKVAWEYHTGDISDGSDNRRKSEFETTPIVADGTMYLSTPFNRVVALDPETGREKWSFDPKIDLHAPYSEGLVNRGVGLWTDPGKGEGEACRRVFLATIDARLFALDATAGTLCTDFGAVGQIDLTRSIANITRRGEYEDTSAPAIAGDLVIVGSSIADNDRVASPSGVVRAL